MLKKTIAELRDVVSDLAQKIGSVAPHKQPKKRVRRRRNASPAPRPLDTKSEVEFTGRIPAFVVAQTSEGREIDSDRTACLSVPEIPRTRSPVLEESLRTKLNDYRRLLRTKMPFRSMPLHVCVRNYDPFNGQISYVAEVKSPQLCFPFTREQYMYFEELTNVHFYDFFEYCRCSEWGLPHEVLYPVPTSVVFEVIAQRAAF